MNYTGNPRHLRARSRSSHKEYQHRQRARTPAILETPHVDICKAFQAPTEYRAGGEVQSIANSSSSREDQFNAKRRRLLQQGDWLGLDIATPINIYDIRAAKEKKRLANGPFMRHLDLPPTELESTRTPVKREPSQVPYTPSLTSHSSTSLHPQPTVPSIQSSQRGVPFVPSRHATPFSAQNGLISSKSSSSGMTFNRSVYQQNSVSQESPVREMDFFIPDPKEKDVNLFSQTSSTDVGAVWSLIEKRRQEDMALRIELGWGSQSGITGSQQGQHPSPYRDASTTSHDQINEKTTDRTAVSEETRVDYAHLLRKSDPGSLHRTDVFPSSPLDPSSDPRILSREHAQEEAIESAQSHGNGGNTSISLESKDVQRSNVLQHDKHTLASDAERIIEEGSQSGEEDGISWF